MGTVKFSAFSKDLHATPDPALHTWQVSLSPAHWVSQPQPCTLGKPDLIEPLDDIYGICLVLQMCYGPLDPQLLQQGLNTIGDQAKFPSRSKPPELVQTGHLGFGPCSPELA